MSKRVNRGRLHLTRDYIDRRYGSIDIFLQYGEGHFLPMGISFHFSMGLTGQVGVPHSIILHAYIVPG